MSIKVTQVSFRTEKDEFGYVDVNEDWMRIQIDDNSLDCELSCENFEKVAAAYLKLKQLNYQKNEE